MERRIKRKLIWDKKGVSEVVGTILMLAITVVLFSSITVWVSNLPAPQGRVYVEIDATITPTDSSDWSQGGEIRLKHVGGMELDNFWTIIFLDIDGNRSILRMEDSENPLGPFWEVGEVWNYTIGINAITENSEIRMYIIDQDVDTQVWEGTLMGTGVWFSPIILDVWIDSDVATEFADEGPIKYAPADFQIFAQIVDPEGDDPDHGLDATDVWVDLTSIGRGIIQLTDDNFDNIFMGTSRGPDANYSVGYYEFVTNATDYDGRVVVDVSRFAVGGEVGQNPQIAVYGNNESATNIWTVPSNPLHGEAVRIYSTVRNLGGAGALVDIKFYDGNTSNLINSTQELLGFGDNDVSISWIANPGGLHDIIVNATVNDTWSTLNGIYEPDAYIYDNQANASIIVLPTILLVDDDAHINDGTPADTVSFMRASLEASDFNYDYTAVSTGGDGPAFDSGDYRLREFDIVIWMTGYETTDTIKSNDIAELELFLDNGGSLWLISQGAFIESETNAGLNSFLTNYLYTERDTGMLNLTDEPVQGISGHPVTDYFSVTNLTLKERVPGFIFGYDIEPLAGAIIAFTENGNGTLATSYEDTALDQRILVQSFEFSMTSKTADMAQLTYKAITWLGNITLKFGRDLAVSQQYITPENVFYKQPISITGVIRNNGFANESYVNWSLTITNADGDEVLGIKSTPDQGGPVFVGTGQNNSVTIVREWTPVDIGAHSIVFEVDPDNQIIETNERNNVLSNLLESGEINVQYIVLVVDDDSGSSVDETSEIIGALDDLDYDYDVALVNASEDGPSSDMLDNYNAVIWVGGDVNPPLTSNDDVEIRNYLEDSGGRFWLTGKNCVGNSVDGGLEPAYLHIGSITPAQAMPEILYGVDDDPISHGSQYATSGALGDCDVLTPVGTAEGMFYQDAGAGDFCAIRNEDDYRTVVTAFSVNSLSNVNARNELVFLVLHWFDKPDDRTELRITTSDIEIRDSKGPMEHPQIGDAYILQARVYNHGGSDANFLVRFLDGTTQIGSDSISVSANSHTTAEIVWAPLFAGQRDINVKVDPLKEADEIFEWFNNNATKSTYVYFFWDDMESGTSRWEHSSTVMLINGETPLDYFSKTELYTNIATDWNETDSEHMNITQDQGFFSSFDTAFWLQEPPGNLTGSSVTRADTDPMAQAIITETRYMDDDNIMVNTVTANDLATSQTTASEFSQTPGGTGVSVATGVRIWIMDELGTPTEVTPGSAVALVVRPWSNGEAGTWSATYTIPGDIPMNPTDSLVVRIYQDMDTANPTTEAASFTTEQLGADTLLNSIWTFYYYTEHSKTGSTEWARFYYGDATYNSRIEGIMYNIPNQSPTTPDNPYPADAQVGISTEDINLTWECSDFDGPWPTSYDVYFGNSSTSMSLIANNITENYTVISGLQEQQIYFWYVVADDTYNVVTGPTWIFATSLAAGIPGRAPDGPNYNKSAITESVDLRNTEIATLSFWHKYNIISGINGGVLMVGYREAAGGDHKFKYVIPTSTYTGSMNTSDMSRQDDFGTWMRWAWNGVSTRGTFGWEKVTMNILSYIPEGSDNVTGHEYRSDVRIKFAYYQYGSGSGYGWYIDDVRMEVSRSDYSSPDSNTADIWNLTNEDAHSGNYSWSNYDPDDPLMMKGGIDNYLMTTPIDLTNARWANLSAYFKFNINTRDGAPPDGFRVEVSTDNGVSWKDMTLGVRSAWNVSGSEADADDGNMDGKSYSGLDPDGDYWVEAGTLTRLNIDLTPHVGKQVKIRFRVATTEHPMYINNEDSSVGFGGFWVDDVIVYGETTNVYG